MRPTFRSSRLHALGFAIALASPVHIGFGTLRAASENASDSKDKDKVAMAVNVVRVINTAEALYHEKAGHYTAWEELLTSSAFAQAREQMRYSYDFTSLSFRAEPEVIPGFELRLVISAEGARYGLSLIEKENNKCGLAVFSDERGMIYLGEGLNCASESDKP